MTGVTGVTGVTGMSKEEEEEGRREEGEGEGKEGYVTIYKRRPRQINKRRPNNNKERLSYSANGSWMAEMSPIHKYHMGNVCDEVKQTKYSCKDIAVELCSE